MLQLLRSSLSQRRIVAPVNNNAGATSFWTQRLFLMASSCSAPTVDFDALSRGLRHRHECHVLRKVCLFNGTLVPHFAAGEHATHAQSVAQKLVVRSQFGSHQTFSFEFYK